jgi:hypothetical protein
MKLESLQLDKFHDKALKREQMFKLNGGGIETPAGNTCEKDPVTGVWENFNYGYDAIRSDGTRTFHNRTCVTTNCPTGNGG